MNASFKFGRYADLLVDPTFKHILGINGKRSMISLLKTFLPIGDIEDIEYINTEDVGAGAHDRAIRYDIACRTADGKHAIVEAQILDQPYFNHRAMFYASRMINYSVLDINERIRKENEKRKSEGKQEIIWNYHFSPVFLLAIFKGTDRAEQQWLYTMKNLPSLEEIPDWINNDDIRTVYDKAEFANLPHGIVQNYAESMTTEMDYKMIVQETAQESLAKGLAQGLAEGKAEGKAEIAKAMKLAGEPVEKIVLYSGLTSEQVELL